MATSFTKDLGAFQIAVIELEFALGEEFGIKIPDASRGRLGPDDDPAIDVLTARVWVTGYWPSAQELRASNSRHVDHSRDRTS